jgi:hypothetical protein
MPFSPLKDSESFGGAYRLHLQGWRVSFCLQDCSLGYASFMHGLFFKHAEVVTFSETSPGIQRATWHYIPKEQLMWEHKILQLMWYLWTIKYYNSDIVFRFINLQNQWRPRQSMGFYRTRYYRNHEDHLKLWGFTYHRTTEPLNTSA